MGSILTRSSPKEMKQRFRSLSSPDVFHRERSNAIEYPPALPPRPPLSQRSHKGHMIVTLPIDPKERTILHMLTSSSTV